MASTEGITSPSTDALTGWTTTNSYLGSVFNHIVGTADLLLGLQAIIANALVISFYFPSYKKVVPFMYLLMAACDSITGIGAILTAIMFFLLETDTYKAALHIVPVAYAIYSITFKVSVFLNLAIAIVRTINILLPFYRMRIIGIGVATATYSCGLLAFTLWQLASWDAHHISLLDTYVYSPGQYQVLYNGDTEDKDQCRNVALFISFPYLIPSCIVLVCMAVQIRTILKQRPDRNANTQTQRQITITIFMLTVLFFICNTAYVYYPIHYCLIAHGVIKIDYADKSRIRTVHMMSYLTGVMCPFINAALNPVILIMRGQALSGFLKRKLQRFSTTAQNNVTNISMASIKMEKQKLARMFVRDAALSEVSTKRVGVAKH